MKDVCEHIFSSPGWRDPCDRCGLAFNFIQQPGVWRQDGKPRKKVLKKKVSGRY